MAKQLIFTSCRKSRDQPASGIQVWTYSDGMTDEQKRIVPKIGSYGLRDTPFDPNPEDMSVIDTYPRAFRYAYTDDGSQVLSLSRFIGPDWSDTRFGANYCSHGICTDRLPGYPIEYLGSPSLRDGVSKEEVSSEQVPGPLPDIDPVLSDDRRITRDSMEAFMDTHDWDAVRRIMYALMSGDRKVTIADIQGNIPYWIAAVTMSLPPELARLVSFSTFGNLPELQSASIVTYYTDTEGIRILSPTEQVPSAAVDVYMERASTDGGFVEGFSRFLDGCGEGIDRLDQLSDYLAMYLYASGDGDYSRFVGDSEIIGILRKSPLRYGEDVLYRCLSGRMSSSMDDGAVDLYQEWKGYLADGEHRESLSAMYLEYIYGKVRSVTDPDVLASSLDRLKAGMSAYMESGSVPAMDTPAEAVTVLRMWEETGDSKYDGLLASASVSGAASVFKAMAVAAGCDIGLCTSDGCALGESLKDLLRSVILSSDFRNMSVSKVMDLMDSFKSDPENLKLIFQEIYSVASLAPVVEKCLDLLPEEGSFTFSDAVSFCLSKQDCPYLFLLKYFSSRSMAVYDTNVSAVINRINQNARTVDPSREEKVLYSYVVCSFDQYDTALGGRDNRILAAVLSDKILGDYPEVPSGWNYRPDADELRDYVLSNAPAFAERAKVGNYIEFMNLFYEDLDAVADAFCDYFSENQKSFRGPEKAAVFTAAAVTKGMSEETTAKLAAMYFGNRRYKHSEAVDTFRKYCPDPALQESFEKHYEEPKGIFGSRHGHKDRDETGEGDEHRKEPEVAEGPEAEPSEGHTVDPWTETGPEEKPLEVPDEPKEKPQKKGGILGKLFKH